MYQAIKRLLFIFFLFTVSASAQGFRIGDSLVVTSAISAPGPLTTLQAIVNICASPANAVPCTNKATTYTSVTLGTPCSTSTQVVLAGTTNCIANSDARGNWGAWVAAGTYDITFTLANASSFGPFTVNVGTSGAFQVTPTTCTAQAATGIDIHGNAVGCFNPTASAASPVTSLQKNTGGALASSNVSEPTTGSASGSLKVGEDAALCGPNPFVDLRCYGVRPAFAFSAPVTPGTTASCTSGLPTVTISASSGFINGDGVLIYNCGAAHSMATPGVPTVTPSEALIGANTGYVVNAPVGGATTYTYVVVARNAAQGLTAASAAGSTSSGSASLGTQSVSLTSCSRSQATVTCLTSSPHGLAVGAEISISTTLDSNGGGSFSGWYQVQTVPDNTHFTYHTGNDTRNGAPASSTGGTVTWWNCNHVTWAAVTGAVQYYVYGRIGGSLTLLYATPLVAGPNTFLSFDDFGSTMTGTALPYFVPSTPPVSATNNSLSTTILSGGGTTSLTLNANAGNSASGQTILLDAVPGINAAIAAGGSLVFPGITIASGTYPIQSQISFPSQSLVTLIGGLTLNDTIVLNQSNVWAGKVFPYNAAFGSFSYDTGAPITVAHAYPGIFISGGNSVISNFNMSYPANGMGIELYGINETIRDAQITTGNDYTGSAIYMPGSFGANPFSIHFSRLFLSSNQGLVTPGALVYCGLCGQMKMDTLQFSGKGVMGLFQDLDINGGRIQAGSEPFVTGINQSTVRFHHYEEDTMANPLYAQLLTTPGTNPTVANTILIDDSGNPSSDGVSVPPLVSGDSSLALVIATGGSFPTGSNTYAATNYGVNGPGFYATGVSNPGVFGGNNSRAGGFQAIGMAAMGYAMPIPAVTVTPGAHSSCAANCVAAGTYNYQISAIDFDGRESGVGPQNKVTVDGTQTIQVCWTPVQGQIGQRRFRGGVSDTNPGTNFGGVANCYNDTSLIAYSNNNFNAGGNGTYLSSSGVVAQQTVLVDQSASGFSTTLKTNPLTANRNFLLPDASVTSVQGNGSKLQLGSGSTVTNDLLKYDANGNAVDSGVSASTVAGGFTAVNVTPVTANANVTTDQNGQFVTITAGTLNSLNKTMLVQLAGVYSTAAASTAVITDKIKLCTVSGCGSGTVITLATWTTPALGGITATNNPYNATINFSTQTAGAAAAFEAHGNLVIDLAALAAAAESIFADNNTATVGTIDSTAQLFLQHTRAFSAASASNSFTDRQLIADTVD